MTSALQVERLSKRFAQLEALRDISFCVSAGEVFGLVGRNGQGKTTLLKCLCGLMEPSAGSIRVFGRDSQRAARDLKRCIGLVTAEERSFYFRLSGRHNLRFFGRLHGLPERPLDRRIEELAQLLDLGPCLDRHFHDYSSGNKQRLAVARALLTDPPLLLLDEPTRSLDPFSAQALRGFLASWVRAQPTRTIVITSHDLDEVERLCGRVGVLDGGRLTEEGPVALLKRRYVPEERVRVLVSGRVSAHVLAEIAALDGVSVLGHEEQRLLLGLTRHSGDLRLDRLLRALLGCGATIEDCAVERSGLREVLARMESA